MKQFFHWILLLVLAVTAAAQEPPQQGPATQAYPGVSEVLPRVSRLVEEEINAEAKLTPIREMSPFRERIQEVTKRQQELIQRITSLGDPTGWSFDRLQDTRGQLFEHKNNLKKILDDLSARLASVELIRQTWNQKEQFWKGWQESLDKSDLELPQAAFEQAQRIIGRVLKLATESAGPLVQLQNEVTALQKTSLEVLSRLDTLLKGQREQTFRKTTHSFANRNFYRQFNFDLWREVDRGIEEVEVVGWEFLQDQGWVLALQALLALSLAAFILHHRKRAEVTREWQFIMNRPWATGIFVSVSSLSALYDHPPALWRLLLWIPAAYSASLLVSGLLKNPRKIFTVYLLATLFILSLALQIISLPTPLYRLYLALLSLGGIPLLLFLARSNLKAHAGKVDGFTLSLRVGAAVLFISLAAQFGGFSTLSSRLIESSVKTVFLGLFAAMAIRLGRGGIEFLLTHPAVRQRRFFRRYGTELMHRLKEVFQIFVVGYATLYLLEVWGIYDSIGQAWSELLAMGFDVGEVRVSVQTVLLVGLVLYVSIVVSWFIRAVLDSQVFPRQGFDRGVRDAIKKLLHYALVLVGFLFAMSLAGMELRNFAVLAGAFGIGIGFGLQNIVNNFVSGLILLFERPIKVGDMVVLGTEWGTVRKIGLRSTIVETLDQSEIIVPNSQLISEQVTNWTLSTNVARVVLPVGVAYGSNVPLVLKLLKEVAVQHPDVIPDPSPSPIFTGFGDSSLDFELRIWIGDIQKRLKIKSELNQAIDQAFRDAGVEIPFPQRDLHLRSLDEAIRFRTGRERAGVRRRGDEARPSPGRDSAKASEKDEAPEQPVLEEDEARED